jgi:hypothetical protein
MPRQTPATHRLLRGRRAYVAGQDAAALLAAVTPSTKCVLISHDERLMVLEDARRKVGITHSEDWPRQNINKTHADLRRIYLLGHPRRTISGNNGLLAVEK